MATNTASTADAQRTFWLLVGGIFTVAINSQVMNPILPAVAEDFDVSTGRVGLAVTAYLLPYGVFQLLYGPLADRVGRVKVIGFALAAASLGTLLCALAPNLNTLIVFRLLTGGTAAAVTPLTFTYIGDTIEYSRRQAAIGYTAMSLSLGNVSAAALGGLLAAIVSWRAIFVLLSIISATITLLIMRQPAVEQRPTGPVRSPLAPLRIAFSDSKHRLFFLLVLFEGTIVLGAFSYFGLILRERDDFSYAAIGVIISLFGLSSVVAARFLGRLAARVGEQRMIALGGSAIISGFFVMTISPPIPFFLLSMMLIGFGYPVMHTTVQTRATELSPTARASGVAIFAFSLFLGGSIGSLIFAQLFDHAGYNPTIFVIAGLALAFVPTAVYSILRFTQPTRIHAQRP